MATKTKTSGRKTARKATARKTTKRKATARKTTARKSTARKTTAKSRTSAKKRTAAKRSTTKRASAKRSTAKRSTAKKRTTAKKAYTSPFATSFNSSVKRGTACATAVANISKRTGKTQTAIWNSLWKAGLVGRVKFNGQWVYWAANGNKTNANNRKAVQAECWQNFADLCIGSGFCTPEQFKKNATSQSNFMKWAGKFWSKQYNKTSTSKTASKTKSKARGRRRAA